MKYDFDTFIPRRYAWSAKWKALYESKFTDPDIVPFSTADMEFRVAPAVEAAVREKADFGIYGYTIPTDEYRKSVCSWMERRHDWKIKPEWMIQTYGVVPAIITAIHALTEKGDGVIIQPPVYFPFHMVVNTNERKLVYNPLKIENGRYVMDYDDLRKKAKDPKTKLLVLCNPHNPVGRVWESEELKELGRICNENGVTVFSDEIHFDFIYKPHKHTVYANLGEEFRENCIVGTAASKSFNLAGLCTSNIIIPSDELRKKFDNQMWADVGMYNNGFGLFATQAAYDCSEEWFDALLEYLDGNRKLCMDFFKENFPSIKVFDLEATYLLWLDCRSFGLNKDALERFMVDEAQFFMDEGYIFGKEGEGYERINIACPRHLLIKGLKRLKSAAAKRGLPL
jgi:cysteine-S-conjugate beta-lyase